MYKQFEVLTSLIKEYEKAGETIVSCNPTCSENNDLQVVLMSRKNVDTQNTLIYYKLINITKNLVLSVKLESAKAITRV